MRRGTKAKGGKRGGRSRSVGTKTKMPAARGDASAAVRARKRPEKTLELNEVLQPRASTTANLPTPDFTFDPDAPGACIAGVRPYRNGSYRLDAETASGKFIVHNYGHGGAGIKVDKSVCQGLVDHIASLFGKAPARPLSDIHIHHPDHAPIVNPAVPGF